MARWRVFTKERDLWRYLAETYWAMLQEYGATRQGHIIYDHSTDPPTEYDVRNLTKTEVEASIATIGDRFPIYGRIVATGAENTTGGYTKAWAEPYRTADGAWAVMAYDQADPAAVDEPAWPPSDGPT